MTRKTRNRAILAKIETVYGTDAVPTGAANAMLMVNSSITPIAGSEEQRDLIIPQMGHQGIILTGTYVEMTGEVEIAGSGIAGTPPAWGVLVRASGFSETIDVGVSVIYEPVSSGHEAATIYYNEDGVNHALVGARGTVTIDLTPQKIPRLKFSFKGLKGTVADTALPTVNVSAFVKPVVVNKANTTVALHGYSGACEGLTLDVANQIEPRLLINSESIEQVDRMMTGNAVMAAAALATIDWFTIALDGTIGALEAVHGVTAGSIVQLDADAVQIGRVTYGESQKIVNNSLPLMMTIGGSNEFSITVT